MGQGPVQPIRRFRKEQGTGAEMRPAIIYGTVTGQAPVSHWPMSQVTVPEVFAKGHSPQFPSRFLSGEYSAKAKAMDDRVDGLSAKKKNNPKDENDYLSLVREKYSTVKIAANPAKYIDDGHAKPAGHLFHVAHDGKVKDQSAAKMNYPKNRVKKNCHATHFIFPLMGVQTTVLSETCELPLTWAPLENTQ